MTQASSPQLQYERAPCPKCGAATEIEAEEQCIRPRTSPTSGPVLVSIRTRTGFCSGNRRKPRRIRPVVR
jgi:hypothetical protein